MKNAQMEQLMKIVQGYEEKNNATTGMMAEMKKMFEEKLQTLEKENDMLKKRPTRKIRHKRLEVKTQLLGRARKLKSIRDAI